MVNQEILEGLRTALARGYSLQAAMMSFFNAGYKKADIEEAARALYAHPSQQPSPEKPSVPSVPEPEKSERPVLTQPLPTAAKPGEEKKEMPVNMVKAEVSKYGEKTNPKGKLKIILLIIILILLLGILTAIFLFKDELFTFFENLFA